MKIIRTETLAERTGAYYVRIQAMAVKHHIYPEDEFDEHDTPDTKYIVIADDVLPVATCRLYPLNESQVMLGRIVVLPEYRNKGLGKLAVLEAEKWSAEMGFGTAVIESRENKTGFYEKLGYVPEYDKVIHGKTFTCIHMEKPLLITDESR